MGAVQLYMGDNGRAGMVHRAKVIFPRKRLLSGLHARNDRPHQSIRWRRPRCREPVFASASSIQTGA
jgi:hypothetical protein